MPMNGSFILDTNIVIALFGNDATVVAEIKKARTIYLPAIVVGELYYGALNSSKPKQNSLKIDELLNEVSVLNCDTETGKFYGRIKKELKDIGKPIPENDIWIIALAKQHNIKVVSRGVHFENVANLKLEKWQ
jgi:tRNA(fMet)-specific endonuclease VapC